MDDELPVELDPPDGVDESEAAIEVLRAWIGALVLVLPPLLLGSASAFLIWKSGMPASCPPSPSARPGSTAC